MPNQPSAAQGFAVVGSGSAAPAATPGGRAEANGQGCPASVPVVVSIDGRRAGQGVSGSDGRFAVVLDVAADLPIGSRPVTAVCGGVTLAGTLDLVLISATSSGPTSVALLLSFFLLIGLATRNPFGPRD